MAKDPGPFTPQSPLSMSPRSSKRRRKEPRRDQAAFRVWFRTVLAFLGRLDWGRAGLAAGTVLILTALLSLHLIPDKVPLRLNDRSTHEIRALRTVQYIDHEATRLLQNDVAARVDPVYTPLPHAESDADQNIREACYYLRREQAAPAPSAGHAAAQIREHVGLKIEPPSVLAPLVVKVRNSSHLDQAGRIMQQVIHGEMVDEIRDDRPGDLERARRDARDQIAKSMLPRAYVPAVTALVTEAVTPNRVFDKARTELARDTERRNVAPQASQIYTGDIVVREGELVTSTTIDKLRALGLQNPRLDPAVVASVGLLIALMVLIVTVFLARFHAPIYQSPKLLTLLSLLTILSVLGLRLGDITVGTRLTGASFGYCGMLCVASAGMLIASLIHPRVAFLITALLAAQSCVILGTDLRFPIMTLLSSLVGIYAVIDIRSRSDVLRAAAALCLANVALSLIVGRIAGDLWPDLGQSLLWAAAAGVLSVAVFSLGAALFERPFGVTTHLGLLELSDPNRPLLQKFCQLAPGTYTHSVMVGNLAVAAAEAIGADALLCRVGAYYHDLGKMRRPEFFVENQTNGENAHSRLNPSLSALVLTAHVREGLEIAEEERLPPVIKSFITEHHGTSLVRFFYSQHLGQDTSDIPPGLEERFRYGGPKPQSRETAILMLADGVEAASRTLEKPTVGRVQMLVDKIIGAQLSDGQLDESDVTLRDLRGIREAFVRLLTGMLHSRIEYPELVKEPAGFVERYGITHSAGDKALSGTAGRGEPDEADPDYAAA